jgi:predicted nucleic acid-binding protein
LRLGDYDSSDPIFVDANVYLDYALANPQTYKAIEEFFEKVEFFDLEAVTTPSVLDEVSYVLLMYKGAKILKTGDHRKIGNKIKKDESFAFRCYSVVDKFKEFLAVLKGQRIISVSKNDFEKASILGKSHRLLPTDSLHAAVMKNNSILNIATRDSDFTRIDGVEIWKP